MPLHSSLGNKSETLSQKKKPQVQGTGSPVHQPTQAHCLEGEGRILHVQVPEGTHLCVRAHMPLHLCTCALACMHTSMLEDTCTQQLLRALYAEMVPSSIHPDTPMLKLTLLFTETCTLPGTHPDPSRLVGASPAVREAPSATQTPPAHPLGGLGLTADLCCHLVATWGIRG